MPHQPYSASSTSARILPAGFAHVQGYSHPPVMRVRERTPGKRCVEEYLPIDQLVEVGWQSGLATAGDVCMLRKGRLAPGWVICRHFESSGLMSAALTSAIRRSRPPTLSSGHEPMPGDDAERRETACRLVQAPARWATTNQPVTKSRNKTPPRATMATSMRMLSRRLPPARKDRAKGIRTIATPP